MHTGSKHTHTFTFIKLFKIVAPCLPFIYNFLIHWIIGQTIFSVIFFGIAYWLRIDKSNLMRKNTRNCLNAYIEWLWLEGIKTPAAKNFAPYNSCIAIWMMHLRTAYALQRSPAHIHTNRFEQKTNKAFTRRVCWCQTRIIHFF